MSILASQQAQAWGSIIMWVVIMVVFVYFFMIRPQKKERADDVRVGSR